MPAIFVRESKKAESVQDFSGNNPDKNQWRLKDSKYHVRIVRSDEKESDLAEMGPRCRRRMYAMGLSLATHAKEITKRVARQQTERKAVSTPMPGEEGNFNEEEKQEEAPERIIALGFRANN